jgi:hydroxymethylpyrimidine pyrophosphatase-like HAD family hydrolase
VNVLPYAFLFDIDGCLTLPDHGISILDVDLLDQILTIPSPVAMITGRSDGWLRHKYKEVDRSSYLNIPTYIEFGLAYLEDDKVIIQEQASDFLSIREKLILLLAHTCVTSNIFFEPRVWYDDYPAHGSLWVEQKHIQLSIAANEHVSVNQVHRLTAKAWNAWTDKVRIINHHLGVDVIPKGWSKVKAVEHFLQAYSEEQFQWYVFGDNPSDEEMATGLTNFTFVSTKEGASYKVKDILTRLKVIFPK